MDITITLKVPDDLAPRLRATPGLERRTLEALALEEFKRGAISKPELRRLLGYETRYELDCFLVSHGVFGTYTEADLARDREDLKRIGL